MDWVTISSSSTGSISTSTWVAPNGSSWPTVNLVSVAIRYSSWSAQRRPRTISATAFFNADGGEVEQCGNGARCFLHFVRAQGLTTKKAIRVETLSGVIDVRLQDDNEVTVDMGPPRFSAADVPFVSDGDAAVQTLEVGGARIAVSVLSMGNPHAVQFVPSVETAPVGTQGPLIEHSPRFPFGANAGYTEVVDRHHVRLRVWERGAGETLACGTGACAAAVAGMRLGLLDSPVRVAMRGGILTIDWHEGGSVMMTGPAAKVFDGEWNVPSP